MYNSCNLHDVTVVKNNTNLMPRKHRRKKKTDLKWERALQSDSARNQSYLFLKIPEC